MAYQGYLIKVGSYTIPLNMIAYDTYKVLMSTQDLDSYRDADGVLHRNALSHKAYKVEFETKNMLTNAQFATLMSNIRANYIDANEKKVSAMFYVPEIDDYVTAYMYVPDITPQINTVINNVIKYDQIRLAFIGY